MEGTHAADIEEIEGFPMVETEREMLPATLGIDALSHKELIRRTKAAIKKHIDVETWKKQLDSYKLQRREVRKLIQ